MKKYYFESIYRILIYVFMIMFFTAILIFAVIAKDTTSQESTVIVISFCSVINPILLIWVCYSLSMRIQIDYEKKELYIRQYYFIKRIKFEDIISIRIIPYNEVAFDFVVTTKKFTKKMAYARYLKRKPNEKIKNKLNDLKQDLLTFVGGNENE